MEAIKANEGGKALSLLEKNMSAIVEYDQQHNDSQMLYWAAMRQSQEGGMHFALPLYANLENLLQQQLHLLCYPA